MTTAVDEVLKLRTGVCQDFAHLFIAVARAMGVPTRYVSGYVYAGGGMPTVGASHAWAEAWLPGRGWLGYDAKGRIWTASGMPSPAKPVGTDIAGLPRWFQGTQ